ncbi:MAG: tetratricopeptide repeat protein [Proteobacteria bacterium]|nr:tetratricopeptide repeat protein [Pseudomonadota bacterium]
MRRVVYPILAIVAVIPAAGRADAIADCNDGANLTRQIRGCTKVIGRTMLGDPLSTAYMNRGIAYAQQHQLKKAIADFTSSIDANGDNNFAYYNRGNVYLDLGKPDKAISDYSRAIELAPDMSPAFLNRGLANEMIGDRTASISDFRSCLALEPTLYAAAEGLKRLGASAISSPQAGADAGE